MTAAIMRTTSVHTTTVMIVRSFPEPPTYSTTGFPSLDLQESACDDRRTTSVPAGMARSPISGISPRNLSVVSDLHPSNASLQEYPKIRTERPRPSTSDAIPGSNADDRSDARSPVRCSDHIGIRHGCDHRTSRLGIKAHNLHLSDPERSTFGMQSTDRWTRVRAVLPQPASQFTKSVFRTLGERLRGGIPIGFTTLFCMSMPRFLRPGFRSRTAESLFQEPGPFPLTVFFGRNGERRRVWSNPGPVTRAPSGRERPVPAPEAPEQAVLDSLRRLREHPDRPTGNATERREMEHRQPTGCLGGSRRWRTQLEFVPGTSSVLHLRPSHIARSIPDGRFMGGVAHIRRTHPGCDDIRPRRRRTRRGIAQVPQG